MKPGISVFYLIVVLLITSNVQSQENLRQKINFNKHWLFLRLDSSDLINTPEGNHQILYDTSRRDFSSQFLNEYIQSEGAAVSDIIRKEVEDAQSSFQREYPLIISRNWDEVELPHTAKVEPIINTEDTWEGICYYRKTFTVEESWRNKELLLEFEGAIQQSDVWLNGQLIVQHKGGYTPFYIHLNGLLIENEPNEIIIRLDNRAHKNFPVGKDLKRNGFTYWSGLYRSVFLHITNPIHITNAVNSNQLAGGGVFFRTPEVSKTKATALVKTHIINKASSPGKVKLEQVIIDDTGQQLLHHLSEEMILLPDSSVHISQQFDMRNPLLWHPDHPYLYTLRTIVYSDGQKVDILEQRVGFRKLEFSREEGFKINGEPIYMVGTNRHQDYPFIGVALPKNAHYRDLKRIKEAGYNTVRLAHYPQDPAVYDAADELGLMLLDGIPGWQFFNNNAIFKQRVFRDIRDMIHRDRNHPSVILWEPNLNEGYPPDAFRKQCNSLAHDELPAGEYFTAGETYGAKETFWDVAINNWTESPDSVFRNTIERAQNIQPEAPGFIKEYADWEFGGWNSTTRSSRARGEKAMLQALWNTMWEYNANLANYSPYTVGCCTWAMFDNYLSGDHKLYEWGTADYFRLPKFTEYLFRSQLEPYQAIAGIDHKNPVVFIANWWAEESDNKQVIVLSNCDKIILKLNDSILAEQKPDKGPNTYYGVPEKGGHPFDGGNCRYLKHPPFTFNNIEFIPGELKAEGFIDGHKVAEQIVCTPEAPVSIKLWADISGKPIDALGIDAVFIHAAVIDQNGSIACLDNTTLIEFSVQGDAKILGPSIVQLRGGIASVLLQTYSSKPAGIIISAHAKALKPGELKPF